MSWSWPPDIRLGAQTATRKRKTGSAEKGLHHNRDDDGLAAAVKHAGEGPSPRDWGKHIDLAIDLLKEPSKRIYKAEAKS